MPPVSIVIAAYNAGEWIETALRSALNQSLADLEVIVVNDGSTDDTATVCAQFDDPRLRVFHQENAGQSAALNRGAAESSGQFIKFLDADDWLNPEHLMRQFESLVDAPGCVSACRWGYFITHPENPVIREERTDQDYGDPMDWLIDSLTFDEGMMGGWKWLIPRAVWDRCGGWDRRLGLNNDFDFSIRVLLASEGVRFAGGAVYSYRKGISGALSGSRGDKAMASAFLTTELGCQHLLDREDSERVRRLCANRWQGWVFEFFPDYPELVEKAELEIRRLGGSDLKMEGGMVLKLLSPVLGWKKVRRLQAMVRKLGWNRILALKARRRSKALEKY